jgi:hypothetical protein
MFCHFFLVHPESLQLLAAKKGPDISFNQARKKTYIREAFSKASKNTP